MKVTGAIGARQDRGHVHAIGRKRLARFPQRVWNEGGKAGQESPRTPHRPSVASSCTASGHWWRSGQRPNQSAELFNVPPALMAGRGLGATVSTIPSEQG